MKRIIGASFLFLSATFLFLSAQELATRPGEPAQQAAKQPNADPAYQQLRHVTVGPEMVNVSNIRLPREAAIFTFNSGAIYFLAPVNGKVTGAVFIGDGALSLQPPTPEEQRSLSLLTREGKLQENFNELVLRFSDRTYEDLKSAVGATGTVTAASGNPAGLLNEFQGALRDHLKLGYNISGRLLEDIDSSQPGGFFMAWIKGRKLGKLVYTIDPNGLDDLAPDEVSLQTYEDNNFGTWTSFHLLREYANGTATSAQKNDTIHISDHRLDTKIEKSGYLRGDDHETLIATRDGVRVVELNLFPSLRAQSVNNEKGTALDFIQEDKNDDPQFFVILPEELKKGGATTLHVVYSGKDAVQNTGAGNYFPVARSNWYPNARSSDYSNYHMLFRAPKGMNLVGSGHRLREANEGNETISEWESDGEQWVAGFNLGTFKKEEVKIANLNDFQVESFANRELPDDIRSLQNAAEGSLPQVTKGLEVAALGTMDTTQYLRKAMAEAQLSVQLYTDYFGPSTVHRVAMTQQTSCGFGQSWPDLVYLPMCYFYDTTVRHQLGLDDPKGYWIVVGPHEVAHQWWGHTVGWNSYRDQWMSEGFANFSAGLFIQLVRRDPQVYQKFYNDLREQLLNKNRQGVRPIDAAPVTEGYRASNSKVGGVTQNIIYPKGAYILHMIRMMMWNNQTQDAPFKEMMRDFVKTYSGHAATTEDFKAMVEKHMTKAMDVDHNGRMDWFFRPYVYGTTLPNYKMDYKMVSDPKGEPLMHIHIEQGNVDEDFSMLVPLYLELTSGKIIRLGSASMHGNSAIDQEIPLTGVKDLPKRAILNYQNDVLCTQQVKD